MMDKQVYNLESIKDLILQILKDSSGTSTIKNVKGKLREIKNIERDDKKGGAIIKNCITDLQEAKFIRLTGDNGISLTEKGDDVAKIGYSKYRNKQKHKEQLEVFKTWTDVISKIVSISIPIIACCDSIFNIELIPIEYKSFIYGCVLGLAITPVIKAVKKKLCK